MNNNFIQNWNPYTTYLVKKKDIQEWHRIYGETCFYGGVLWELQAKHKHCGLYKVRFVKD